MVDLFVVAAESSGDFHGARLIEELFKLRPNLNIKAVAGPRMRRLPIDPIFPMESLQVMGFSDVLAALPRIARQFYAIRCAILSLNPKAVVCIDYPGFNLRLERSLRKKKYRGKLIHYICPTVWAWGKKRIPLMAETLDLLLTLFPFERECFSSTSLQVEYVGHPLAAQIPPAPKNREPILALFPGSREAEIRRNFPIQLRAARKLTQIDSHLQIAVSIAEPGLESLIHTLAKGTPVRFYLAEQNYLLMQTARAAIATSGTVTLELALHSVPTAVNFAIRPLDLFLAQKIFRIDLPFYCIVNIILSKEVFPELYGPNLTEKNLDSQIEKLWFDEEARLRSLAGCADLRRVLGESDASCEAARLINTLAF